MSDLHEYTAISRFILRVADYYPFKITEPLYDKTNENNYAPIEDSDQSGRIKVLAVRSMGSK